MDVFSVLTKVTLPVGKVRMKIDGEVRMVRILHEVKADTRVFIERREPLSDEGRQWFTQYVALADVSDVKKEDIDESTIKGISILTIL
jgi:hypothetical protein